MIIACLKYLRYEEDAENHVVAFQQFAKDLCAASQEGPRKGFPGDVRAVIGEDFFDARRKLAAEVKDFIVRRRATAPLSAFRLYLTWTEVQDGYFWMTPLQWRTPLSYDLGRFEDQESSREERCNDLREELLTWGNERIWSFCEGQNLVPPPDLDRHDLIAFIAGHAAGPGNEELCQKILRL